MIIAKNRIESTQFKDSTKWLHLLVMRVFTSNVQTQACREQNKSEKYTKVKGVKPVTAAGKRCKSNRGNVSETLGPVSLTQDCAQATDGRLKEPLAPSARRWQQAAQSLPVCVCEAESECPGA